MMTPTTTTTITTFYCCWLQACDQPAVVGRRHKRFGLVTACADHDPARHAYDAPLILPGTQAQQLQAQPVKPQQASGGQRSKLTPTPPPLAPSGTAQTPQQPATKAKAKRVALPTYDMSDAF
jgi:hypothetical protein